MTSHPQPSRRQVLLGAGAVTLTGSAASLAACSGSDAPRTLGSPSQVPVGGGKIFTDAKVVVTQPVEGQFKGFTTRCPHEGCSVASIEDGFIVCPCHNSRFAVDSGQPTADSATPKMLPSVQVSVSDGQIVLD